MKLFIAALFMWACVVAAPSAAEVRSGQHRIVFELTSGGTEQFESVLNNVENVMKALGEKTEIIVVAHGPGLGLVQKTNAPLAARMKPLTDKGVVFAACQNTMKRKKLTKDDLFPFATTVDSGVAEVVRRQEAGWAYIKSGH